MSTLVPSIPAQAFGTLGCNGVLLLAHLGSLLVALDTLCIHLGFLDIIPFGPVRSEMIQLCAILFIASDPTVGSDVECSDRHA
jgi:hypothetical protein